MNKNKGHSSNKDYSSNSRLLDRIIELESNAKKQVKQIAKLEKEVYQNRKPTKTLKRSKMEIYSDTQQLILFILSGRKREAYEIWRTIKFHIVKKLLNEDITFDLAIDGKDELLELKGKKFVSALQERLDYFSDRFISWDRLYRAEQLMCKYLNGLTKLNGGWGIWRGNSFRPYRGK